MTATRQERKSRRPLKILAAALGMAGVLGGVNGVLAPLRAATTERVVTNRYTGLAIDGFDPVAYFVEGAPAIGRPGIELRHADANWRFLNQGNRAAFAADPDIYMPRFGGHDPIAVARGAATAGHPRLWRITGRRLYLFDSEQARATFVENPDRAIEAAERHWPEVMQALTP